MLTVAYLANRFPAPVEPYVADEIEELRSRGVRVIAGSVRRPDSSIDSSIVSETVCLQPIRLRVMLRALMLLTNRWKSVSGLIARVLCKGQESPKQRIKALLHTLLGAYYAALLEKEGVDHIHAHHGYFGSWIAMVAARLLGISSSLTLHGSDLLLHGAYLDTKLSHCRFCLTISEYNRNYILQKFPEVDPETVIVSRLGVDVIPAAFAIRKGPAGQCSFTILAVGRLHRVKNHAFLIRACSQLRNAGLNFQCLIAGEGPERRCLELPIRAMGLQERVHLLGHVPANQMAALYLSADLLALTSQSEGIPLVLMEAMANGLIVLAPAITGIPELITHGSSGFCYEEGNLQDFVERVLFIYARIRHSSHASAEELNCIRHAARLKIFHEFNRPKNLSRFADLFLQSIAPANWSSPDEDPVLQQI
jgi:colanic acid/amylovoran biosynthesis glycosyltransferase